MPVSITLYVIRAVSERIFSSIRHSGCLKHLKKCFPAMPFCHWLKGSEWWGQLSNRCILCFSEINMLVSTYSGLGLSLWTMYQKNILSLQAFENHSLKSILYFLLNLHLVKYFQRFFPLEKLVAINGKLFSPVTLFHLYHSPHNSVLNTMTFLRLHPR